MAARPLKPLALSTAWLELAFVTSLAACREPANPELSREVAHLSRQVRALQDLRRAVSTDALLQRDTVFVGLHERAVAATFAAALPIETTVPGLFSDRGVTIRIDDAVARLDEGYGTVSVQGRAWFTYLPRVAVDVRLTGGIARAEIDPVSHELVASIDLDALDARPLPGGLVARLLRGRLLRALNETARARIAAALPPLVVPLRLRHKVRVPGLTKGPVHIVGGMLTVSVTFNLMFASGGHLWLALEPQLGSWQKNTDRE